MKSDLERVLEKLHHEFPIPPQEEFQGWAVPPLDVLDCVLSLNRNYRRFCLPRVEKFRHAHPKINTLSKLLELIESYPTPLDFSRNELNYCDERRAATLVGVLKSLLHVQNGFNDSDEVSRLRAWAHSVSPTDYEKFGVRGFGLSGFQYLRMLFGAQTVKPDVHIRRFVSDAIGRTVGDEEALVLTEAAGKHLEWPLARLDYAVWDRGARGIANHGEQNSTLLPEIVLEIGSEGGSLTIIRKRIEGVWHFQMKRNEAALYDLLSEEDRGEIVNYFAQTEWVQSFYDVLQLLDQYEWVRLYPLYIHPEFLDSVLLEIGMRGGAQEASRWLQQLKRS